MSASTAAKSESAEPGLDTEGEKTPGLVADMGLEPADERGQMLEAGRLAELGLL